jgi:exodeoxyribonuclease VII small subunit
MNGNGAAPPSIATTLLTASDGSFEEALEALEVVVEHLEQGRLSLDEAVAWYEAGLRLSRRCAELLDQAELRISQIEDAYAIPAQEQMWHDTDDE